MFGLYVILVEMKLQARQFLIKKKTRTLDDTLIIFANSDPRLQVVCQVISCESTLQLVKMGCKIAAGDCYRIMNISTRQSKNNISLYLVRNHIFSTLLASDLDSQAMRNKYRRVKTKEEVQCCKRFMMMAVILIHYALVATENSSTI